MTIAAVARVTRVRQGVERDCHLMAIVRTFEELLSKLAVSLILLSQITMVHANPLYSDLSVFIVLSPPV